MLRELAIENLAVVRRLALRLAGGLTVITGESGAGKSLLLRAVDLAAGARADVSMVREGESAARICLRFEGAGGATALVRELRRDGRPGASLDGRAVRLSDLRSAAEPHLGGGRQGDAYRLRQGGAAEWLDRLEPVPGPRAHTAAAAREVETARQALGRLAGDDVQARAREVEALRFAVAEIHGAAVRVGEREELRRERDRLRNMQRLAEQAGYAREALVPAGEGDGARDLLAMAAHALRQAAALDPDLSGPADRLAALAEGAQEAARDVDRYLDRLVPDPAREEAVSARLDRLAELSRKYGDAEDEILSYAERAQAELARFEQGEGQIDGLRLALAQAQDRWQTCAQELSAARKEAARALELEASAQLRRLALPEARLWIRVETDPETAVSADGMDKVEVLFAAHATAPLLSLGDAASGGETSRVLLALEAVLARARPGATWLFDEVEAGVGGAAAWDVARSLLSLARGGQVLVVSHLAPVAAVADVHLVVEKASIGAGAPESRVRLVTGIDRVRELARMLSGQGAVAEDHASELLARAEVLRAEVAGAPSGG